MLYGTIRLRREVSYNMRRRVLSLTGVVVMIFMLASAVALSAKIKNITAEKANELIEQCDDDQDFVILDVRTPEEFSEGHIENAVNLDFYADAFPDELESLDKEKTYLIYCRTGGRSGNALKMMKEKGFKDVYNMEGGITDWSKSYPVVK
jgi:rhodanese-related sulfurtransferase